MNWMHEGECLHSKTWTRTYSDRSPHLVLHRLTSVPWKPYILLKRGAEITNTPGNEPGQHKCRTSDFHSDCCDCFSRFRLEAPSTVDPFADFPLRTSSACSRGLRCETKRHFRQDCGPIFWQGGVVMKGTPSRQQQDLVLSFWAVLRFSSKLNKVSLPSYLPVKWINRGCKWTYIYLSV